VHSLAQKTKGRGVNDDNDSNIRNNIIIIIEHKYDNSVQELTFEKYAICYAKTKDCDIKER